MSRIPQFPSWLGPGVLKKWVDANSDALIGLRLDMGWKRLRDQVADSTSKYLSEQGMMENLAVAVRAVLLQLIEKIKTGTPKDLPRICHGLALVAFSRGLRLGVRFYAEKARYNPTQVDNAWRELSDCLVGSQCQRRDAALELKVIPPAARFAFYSLMVTPLKINVTRVEDPCEVEVPVYSAIRDLVDSYRGDQSIADSLKEICEEINSLWCCLGPPQLKDMKDDVLRQRWRLLRFVYNVSKHVPSDLSDADLTEAMNAKTSMARAEEFVAGCIKKKDTAHIGHRLAEVTWFRCSLLAQTFAKRKHVIMENIPKKYLGHFGFLRDCVCYPSATEGYIWLALGLHLVVQCGSSYKLALSKIEGTVNSFMKKPKKSAERGLISDLVQSCVDRHVTRVGEQATFTLNEAQRIFPDPIFTMILNRILSDKPPSLFQLSAINPNVFFACPQSTAEAEKEEIEIKIKAKQAPLTKILAFGGLSESEKPKKSKGWLDASDLRGDAPLIIKTVDDFNIAMFLLKSATYCAIDTEAHNIVRHGQRRVDVVSCAVPGTQSHNFLFDVSELELQGLDFFPVFFELLPEVVLGHAFHNDWKLIKEHCSARGNDPFLGKQYRRLHPKIYDIWSWLCDTFHTVRFDAMLDFYDKNVSPLSKTDRRKILRGEDNAIITRRNDKCIGLSRLCDIFFGKVMSKSQRQYNWRVRPLPSDQIEYAVLDSLAILRIWEKVAGIAYSLPYDSKNGLRAPGGIKDVCFINRTFTECGHCFKNDVFKKYGVYTQCLVAGFGYACYLCGRGDKISLIESAAKDLEVGRIWEHSDSTTASTLSAATSTAARVPMTLEGFQADMCTRLGEIRNKIPGCRPLFARSFQECVMKAMPSITLAECWSDFVPYLRALGLAVVNEGASYEILQEEFQEMVQYWDERDFDFDDNDLIVHPFSELLGAKELSSHRAAIDSHSFLVAGISLTGCPNKYFLEAVCGMMGDLCDVAVGGNEWPGNSIDVLLMRGRVLAASFIPDRVIDRAMEMGPNSLGMSLPKCSFRRRCSGRDIHDGLACRKCLEVINREHASFEKKVLEVFQGDGRRAELSKIKKLINTSKLTWNTKKDDEHW